MTQFASGIDAPPRHAALDDAHLGDIRGAFGTIAEHDIGPRRGWRARLRTLLAILGPGLIVMVGDNDAGAFGTYTHRLIHISPHPLKINDLLEPACERRTAIIQRSTTRSALFQGVPGGCAQK